MHLRTCLSFAGIAFTALVALGNCGCGGVSASVPPPPPPPAISVSLSQATATVQAGATTQFTATVVNHSANTRVTRPALARLEVAKDFGELPLSFEVNRGQTSPQVEFLSRGRGYELFLTANEAMLSLRGSQKKAATELLLEPGPLPEFGRLERASLALIQGQRQGPGSNEFNSQFRIPHSKLPALQPTTTSFLRLKLEGANPEAKVIGLQELPGKVNYFIGNDPNKWRTNVPTFAKVKYKDVYPGVDLVYYGNQGQLEYDFVIAPGTDPKSIGLVVEAGLPGHDKDDDLRSPLQVAANGDLLLRTDGGEVRFRTPVVYQPADPGNSSSNPEFKIHRSELLDGHYVLTADNHVHFEISGYDKSKPLVIDSVLSYSTYLGGSGFDGGFAIAVDSSGSAYVTGFTDSSDFPTANPFEAFHSNSQNAMVAKLNPAGTALVYSSYFGGSSNLTYGSQAGAGVAVDASGNAYIAGYTHSCDFPAVNAFQPRSEPCNAGFYPFFNGFVVKLNATGDALLYSTYLGGNDYYFGDAAFGVAVDSSGDAYVTGFTGSTDFPTVNSIQSTLAGHINAFVTKFNATGSALVYSTYLGGSGSSCFGGTQTCGDGGAAIALDSSGNAYVAGNAGSANFPTVNPIQPTLAGGPYDVFVAKLNANGNALVYSTYLGGKGEDIGTSIAVDPSGNAYVTGATGSSDFPTTPGALQGTFGGGSCPSNDDTCGDAFVAKLNAAGSSLAYSTYLGGKLGDIGTGIAVDSSDIAYVTGFTDSADFPTANPLQSTCASFTTGQNCPFVASLSPAGNSLIYSTYLGGSSQGRSYGIALDSASNVYITGRTNATDFPTVNPLQAKNAGSYDVIVSEISTPPDFVIAVAAGSSSSQTVTAGGSAAYTLSMSPLGGFNQTVNLSCTDQASVSTCKPSPASVTLDGANSQNVTVRVFTTAHQLIPPTPYSRRFGPLQRIVPLLFFVVLVLSLLAFGSSTRHQRWVAAMPLTVVLFLVFHAAGCGGGSGSTGPPPLHGTQAGNYTVTITGTSGSLTHTTTVSLNVQ